MRLGQAAGEAGKEHDRRGGEGEGRPPRLVGQVGQGQERDAHRVAEPSGQAQEGQRVGPGALGRLLDGGHGGHGEGGVDEAPHEDLTHREHGQVGGQGGHRVGQAHAGEGDEQEPAPAPPVGQGGGHQGDEDAGAGEGERGTQRPVGGAEGPADVVDVLGEERTSEGGHGGDGAHRGQQRRLEPVEGGRRGQRRPPGRVGDGLAGQVARRAALGMGQGPPVGRADDGTDEPAEVGDGRRVGRLQVDLRCRRRRRADLEGQRHRLAARERHLADQGPVGRGPGRQSRLRRPPHVRSGTRGGQGCGRASADARAARQPVSVTPRR